MEIWERIFISLWTLLVENFKVKEGFDRSIVNGTSNACGDNYKGKDGPP